MPRADGGGARAVPAIAETLRTMKTVLVFFASAVFAIVATIALASTADALHWCCVHGWALLHGSGESVLLLSGLVGFHVVSLVGSLRTTWRKKLPSSWPPGWLAHAAYITAAFGMWQYWTFHRDLMWLGLAIAILAVALRLGGRRVPQFGLAVAALVVSVLNVTDWASYTSWL
jgi:hypothetical protein